MTTFLRVWFKEFQIQKKFWKEIWKHVATDSWNIDAFLVNNYTSLLELILGSKYIQNMYNIDTCSNIMYKKIENKLNIQLQRSKWIKI